jgi:hypothetical protein
MIKIPVSVRELPFLVALVMTGKQQDYPVLKSHLAERPLSNIPRIAP